MAATPVTAETLKDHEERLRIIEKASIEREQQVKELYTLMGKIEQMVADIREDIEALKMRPANRWEQLIGYLIAAIVGAAVAFIAQGFAK